MARMRLPRFRPRGWGLWGVGVLLVSLKRGSQAGRFILSQGFYPECFCHGPLGIYPARAGLDGLETEDHRGMCLTTRVSIDGRAWEFCRLLVCAGSSIYSVSIIHDLCISLCRLRFSILILGV